MRADTVLGLRWLLSLLRTYHPRAAQLLAPPQVRELLAKGAKIEAVDKDGKTALHLAAWSGHVAVVREPPGPGVWSATGIQLRIWDPQRSRVLVSLVDAMVGLRWLLSLLRTC